MHTHVRKNDLFENHSISELNNMCCASQRTDNGIHSNWHFSINHTVKPRFFCCAARWRHWLDTPRQRRDWQMCAFVRMCVCMWEMKDRQREREEERERRDMPSQPSSASSLSCTSCSWHLTATIRETRTTTTQPNSSYIPDPQKPCETIKWLLLFYATKLGGEGWDMLKYNG